MILKICAFLIVILLVFWVQRLVNRYCAYTETIADYHHVFHTERMDPITHERLIRYWKTNSYYEFFNHSRLSMDRSQEETIVFVGLCQDNGKDVLATWMPILRQIGEKFKDYRIIMVENDSLDDTRHQLLRQAEKDDRFIVLCDQDRPENTKTCQLGRRSVEKGGDKEMNLEKRVRTLAKFRQVYWDHVQKKYDNYTYMCIIDWDLEGQLSIPGFFHGLYYARGYVDVVACNSYHKQNGSFYIHDTFPLLNENRCQYLRDNKSTEDLRMRKQMRERVLYGSTYLVPVSSAFGGLALYNIQRVMARHADYKNPICPMECEHSTFHKNLEVYIDPWMTFYITKNRH